MKKKEYKYIIHTYIFKYFLTALQEPNIPTIIPITTSIPDMYNTKGYGFSSVINDTNNLPLKCSYILV